MKLITFAVASIVDANTHYLDAGQRLDHDFALRHGREIRGKSIAASLKALGSSLRGAFERYRSRRQEKRELAILLSMNDALLRDIGLTRNDLIAAQYGATTLEQLQARREAASRSAAERQGLRPVTATPREDASNEAIFAPAKCA